MTLEITLCDCVLPFPWLILMYSISWFIQFILHISTSLEICVTLFYVDYSLGTLISLLCFYLSDCLIIWLLFAFHGKRAQLQIYVCHQEEKGFILKNAFPSLITGPISCLPVDHFFQICLLPVTYLQLFWIRSCSPFRIYRQRIWFLWFLLTLSELLKNSLCIHRVIICFYILLYVHWLSSLWSCACQERLLFALAP